MTNEDPADEVEVSKPKFSFEERVRSQQQNMAALPVAEQRAAKSKPAVARKPVDGYAQALRWTLLATVIITAAVVALAWRTGVAATQVALVAGALGAFFSVVLRMSNSVQGGDSPRGVSPPSLLDRAVYAIVPPLVGAIAAGFVMIVFATGVMEGGAFFPRFGCAPGASCLAFTDIVAHYGPVDAVHYARLCLWAFAAGFAERLVPERMRHPAQRVAG